MKSLNKTFQKKMFKKCIFHNWNNEVSTSHDSAQEKREAYYEKLDTLKNEISQELKTERVKFQEEIFGENFSYTFEAKKSGEKTPLISTQLATKLGEPTNSWAKSSHKKTFYLLNLLAKKEINIDRAKNLAGKTIQLVDGLLKLDGVSISPEISEINESQNNQNQTDTKTIDSEETNQENENTDKKKITIDAKNNTGVNKTTENRINNKTENLNYKAFISKEIPGMLPEVKLFKIQVEINNKKLTVGQFFSFEPNGAASMVSKKKNPELFKGGKNKNQRDFDAVKAHFKKQGKSVSLMFAGGFTPDWENVEGIYFQNGKNAGMSYSEIKEDWSNIKKQSSVVIINPNGEIEIRNFGDDFVPKDLIDLKKETELKNLTIFQQRPIRANGKNVWKGNDFKGMNNNILVRRVTGGIDSYGFLNLKGKLPNGYEISMDDRQKILEDLNITDAVYLDGGPVEGGMAYQNGLELPINNINKGKTLYTNLIVVHSKAIDSTGTKTTESKKKNQEGHLASDINTIPKNPGKNPNSPKEIRRINF